MLSHWLLVSIVSAKKSDFNIIGVPLSVMSHFFFSLALVKILSLSLALHGFTIMFLFVDRFTYPTGTWSLLSFLDV